MLRHLLGELLMPPPFGFTSLASRIACEVVFCVGGELVGNRSLSCCRGSNGDGGGDGTRLLCSLTCASETDGIDIAKLLSGGKGVR